MSCVLVYSIHHTGTWFIISLLSSAYDKGVETEPFGMFYPDNQRKSLHRLPQINHDYNLLILQAHYRAGGHGIASSLKQTMPKIPVVVPMRDPLLSLCTKIWRKPGGLDRHLRTKSQSRKRYAREHILKFKDILSIPDKNRFLFPIDIPDKRNELYKGLYRHCMLRESSESDTFVKQWSPVNITTAEWFIEWRGKGRKDNSISREIKQSILDGSPVLVGDILDVEFDFLCEQEDLKEMLSGIGYKDLVWW